LKICYCIINITINCNKPDQVSVNIRNAEASASIGVGVPVAMVMNGTNDGLDVVLLREPGGTTIGEKIRALLLDKSSIVTPAMTPMTEFLLFSAARAEIVETVIKPALERGAYVICDRFTDSSVVIQGRARGIPDAYIEQINMIATGNLAPDLTILLDIDVKEGLRRVAERGGENRIDLEGVEFHEKVRQEYLVRGMMSPNRFAYIPSREHVDVVAKSVFEIVARMLDLANS